MKKILVLFGLVLATTASAPHRANAGASFGVFYSSLSPHGEWIVVDNGVYAWRPGRVVAGWRPYLYGSWAWTDYGWYWVSDEPWAWATYHYGRWFHDDYYGWVWVPGYDWAPAWVEWRYGGDYLGWAPLGPYAVFSMRFGIYYTRHWFTPMNWWSFVHCDAIYHRDVHRYVYRSDQTARLIGRTRSGGSVRYNDGRIVSRGPERDYVERRSGRGRLDRLDVVDSDDPGRQRVVRSEGRSRIEAYRPRIDTRTPGAQPDRPERVRSGERTLPLDTRNIDLRSRDRPREDGRDLRRAEERRRSFERPTLRRDEGRRESMDRGAPSARNPGNSRPPASADDRVDRQSRGPSPRIERAPRESPPRIERRPPESPPRIERAPWPRERLEKRAPEPRQRYDRPERSSRSGGEMKSPPSRSAPPSRSTPPSRPEGSRRGSDDGRKSGRR